MKILYLTVSSLDPTGKGQSPLVQPRTKAALNAFDITVDCRISAGRR